MKKIYRIIVNVYVLFWVLYNYHWYNVGYVFPVIDSLSNAFLGVNLSMSLICLYLVVTKYRTNRFIKILNLLILLFSVYGIISIIFGDDIYIKAIGVKINNASYLISVLRSFLPIYFFFLFSKLGFITKRFIQIWSVVFLIQTLHLYFSSRLILELDSEDLITNNIGYMFVALFPLITFFNKRTYIQFILVFIFVFFTLMSIKRGAIIVLSLQVIYFTYIKLRNIKLKQKVLVLAVLALGIFYSKNYFQNIYTNDAFQARLDSTLSGNTSGRDDIAYKLLEQYSNSNFLQLIFGHGADGTLKITNNYAHNDWFEILINQGIIGIIVFMVFWLAFLKLIKQEKKQTERLFLVLLFISFFPKTMFSMWYSVVNIFATLPLGYYLSEVTSNNKLYNEQTSQTQR